MHPSPVSVILSLLASAADVVPDWDELEPGFELQAVTEKINKTTVKRDMTFFNIIHPPDFNLDNASKHVSKLIKRLKLSGATPPFFNYIHCWL